MIGIGIGLTSGGRSVTARRFAQGLLANYLAPALVQADGTPVSTWTPSAGLLRATALGVQVGTNRPTFAATGWSDGGPCLTFSQPSKQCLAVDALAPYTSLGAEYTVAALVRRTAPLEDGIIFGVSNGGTVYSYCDLESTAGNAQQVVSSGGGKIIPSGGLAAQTFSDEDTVVIFGRKGASSFAFANGHHYVGDASGEGGVTYTSARIGGMIYGGAIHPSTANLTMRQIAFWNRALTLHDHAAVVNTMGAQNLLRCGTVVLGDSIGSGAIAGPPWSSLLAYPQRCVIASAAGVITSRGACVNRAVSGRTIVTNAYDPTNNETGNLAADVTSTYNPYVPRVILVDLGTNDIYYGATATTALANYFTLLDTIRAACPNDYIVACTLLPRANWNTAPNYGGSDATYDTHLANFNAGLKANYAGHADAVQDFAAIPQMANPANATYYVDLCHPTTLGQAVMGASVPLLRFITACIVKLLGIQAAS